MGSGRYGRSFADKLIEEERYEEALVAADKALRLDEEDSSACADRGTALYHLGRFEESVAAYEKAIELNRESAGLDEDQLDDSYYESLRAFACAAHEAGDAARAAKILDTYVDHAPTGKHKDDRTKWYEIFRGEAPKVITRPRPPGA
jgi:tetratricopeptide (TPR) repeat protein